MMLIATWILLGSAAGAVPSPLPLLSAEAPVAGDFDTLLGEYEAAVDDWKTELRAARKHGNASEVKERNPVFSFYARFDELAQAGEGQAILWLSENVYDYLRKEPGISARKAEAAKRKIAWYEILVRDHAKADWAEDIVDALTVEKRWIGEPKVRALLLEFADKTADDDLAAQVLLNVSTRMLRGEPTEDQKLRAQEIRERILADYPDSSAAEELEGLLFKEKYLRVGAVAPDFTTEDVEGVEFKLSDYRGKVVLLDFWGFW